MLVPVTETKLKASYGTGFKAPTLNELFVELSGRSSSSPIPNLRPEESTGWDVGFEQPLFDNRVRFGATYFHNDIDEPDHPAPDPARGVHRWHNINIGKAKTSGVEAFVRSSRSSSSGSAPTTPTPTRSMRSPACDLLRRPRHKASVTAAWMPIEPLTLSATVLHVGEWVDGNRDFSIPRLIAPGYTVVNLAADYRLNEYAKVFARIDNLFDERYENPTGFLRPGFAVYGGMRLNN